MESDNATRRRDFLTATGGAAATLALAGCFGGGDGNDNNNSSDGGDVGEADDTSDDNVLNMINSTMSSLDPIQSTDTASGRVIRHVYETLTTYPDGVDELENLLMDSYEVSDDQLTYTITIKEGVQFHDGSELTAQDIVYSWRRLAESENSERVNFITGSPSHIAMVAETETVTEENEDGEEEETEVVVPDSLALEAVDDTTIEFTIEVPSPEILDILTYDALAAVPEGIVGDIEGYDGEIEHDEFSSSTMVGTGPFEFDGWDPNNETQVSRFDDYHGSAANVDAVHWQIIEDDEAAYTYAIEQNADVFGIPTSYYDPSLIDAETDDQGRDVGTYGPLDNGATVNYAGVPQLSTYYFAYNASNVPLAVRQAIAYVTNKEELLEQVFQGRGVTAQTFTPPGIWPGGQDAYESFVGEYAYSPGETDRDSAQQVLEEAGYTEDDPFELTLTTYESPVYQEAGRLTRDKVSGLGIELNLEEAPFSTLIQRGQNGNVDMYSLGWTWSWPSLAYGLYGFEPENTNTSLMPGEANGYYLDWQTEDSDAVQSAQEAWETVEANPEEDAEETRNEAYVALEQAVQDDMVLMPLMHDLQEQFWYQYVDKNVSGTMGAYMQVHNETSLQQE